MGTKNWIDRDTDYVARRYDWVAPFIPGFESILGMPAGFRARGVEALSLRKGQSVLEIGCGTGRNMPYLRESVGVSGQVYGVDISEGMLSYAHDLCARHEWNNVQLNNGSALTYEAPELLDGILFGLSYNTMPNHLAVLQHAWDMLRPGGRLVIMDAKAPDYPLPIKRALLWSSALFMQGTLLGNPYILPWKHVEAYDPNYKMDEFQFGSYYVCRAVKPLQTPAAASRPAVAQGAAEPIALAS